ncbi:MAG: adenylyl-sulfate kinase [Methylococcus sp.]|jgi:adenylylsulfate kinase|nr:MAG: adenylyl-sulfate kinase [Methylococcus sp.]
MNTTNLHLVRHAATVTRHRRAALFGHRSAVLWFTGLSGAGKSTLAHAVEESLHQRGSHTYVLDGDNVRHGLCSDLRFSLEDRSENIRRIGETAKLFVDAGCIVLTAFISPLRIDREQARRLFEVGDFFEIYCRASIEICEQRDIKGLYQKARRGEIKEFTGISSPYEEPIQPDLIIDTGAESLEDSVERVLAFLLLRDVLKPSPS